MNTITDKSTRLMSPPSVFPQFPCLNNRRASPLLKTNKQKSDDVSSSRLRRNATNGATKTGKRMFHCPLCRYITDRKNNLKRHLSTMHRECTEDKTTCYNTRQQFDCCRFLLRNKAELSHAGVDQRHQANKPNHENYLTDESYRHHQAASKGGSQWNSRKEKFLQYRTCLGADSFDAMSVEKMHHNVDEIQRADYLGKFLERVLTYDRTTPSKVASSSFSPSSSQPLSFSTDTILVSGTMERGSSYPSKISFSGGQSSTSAGELGCNEYAQVRFEPRPPLAYRKPSSRMFFYNRLVSTHGL